MSYETHGYDTQPDIDKRPGGIFLRGMAEAVGFGVRLVDAATADPKVEADAYNMDPYMSHPYTDRVKAVGAVCATEVRTIVDAVKKTWQDISVI